jgi:hypothetical protein
VLLLGFGTVSGNGFCFITPLRAEPITREIPLQCRLGNGPWQDCRMRVEQVGSHWWLQVGPQTLEFRHDGRGSVTMQAASSGWRAVESRWEEDTSLCWDGVCARGEIPLD